jgi:hypothetical protein
MSPLLRISLTFPEPMSYSLTVTESGGLTLGLTGPAGPAGATGGVTSVAGRTGPVTLVSADITDATEVATANTVAKRDSTGGGVTFGTSESEFGVAGEGLAYGVYGFCYDSIAIGGETATGTGLSANSNSGTGASISTVTGTYHALFGNTGSNRSFVALLNGAFGWFRNSNRTLTIEAAATLAASRTYIIPDATGTTVPIVPAYTDLTAANAAALGAGTFFWNTALKKLQVTTV